MIRLIAAVACSTLLVFHGADGVLRAQTTAGTDVKAAAPDTDKALKAKRVSTRIVVHLINDANGKHVRYVLDNENNTIGHKADGALFSTSSDLLITYPKMNPLKLQATASVSEIEDPMHAVIAQLIAAISGVPGLVNPDLATDMAMSAPRTAGADPGAFLAPQCQELIEAERVLGEIQSTLYGPTVSSGNLADQFQDWNRTFDDTIGPGGGSKAAKDTSDKIDLFYTSVRAQGDKAAAAIKLAQDRAGAALQTTVAQREYNDALAQMLAGKDRAGQIRELSRRNDELAALRAAVDGGTSCAQDALNLYRLVVIANPQVRLAEVRKLEKAVADLRDVLRKTYVGDGIWFNNTEYVLAKDITVARGKMARVTVKVAPIKVEASDATLRVSPQEATSASFDIREHTMWVPELGVGATFAVLDRPKYGTAVIDGRTVVSKAKTESFGVSPTVLVNFVPVGVGGATPIIQLGASTSTSAPAIFFGPGWRMPGVTGKSGAVFGVGAVLGWVKDLESLVPEVSEVTGTKDIEKDLKFDPKPKWGFYVNLQYKF